MPFNKIGSKGITDGSVASAEFADGVVTSAKLQNSAVTNDKLTNTTVSLSGTSITLGSSATFNNKFVDWQSVIVADGSTGTTGVSGRGYFINTTSAAHTFTLPTSATRGDNISIKDYAGTFATNNLTIARNGHNIQGVANNSLISTNRASVVLVYVDVTRGWEFVEESNVADLQQTLFITATGGTITTSGDYKIHSFTGDGCFLVTQVGAGTGPSIVDYLVVAGGGAGGGIMGGGGGAGGYRESSGNTGPYTASPLATPTGITVSTTTYPVTVGAGGAITVCGGGFPSGGGFQGSSSTFSNITSAGGGARCTSCGVGGSGAGKNRNPGCGAAGNTPPVSPPQGNPGGPVPAQAIMNDNAGAGGGGAGGSGSASTGTCYPGGTIRGGAGGNGTTSSITGTPVTRAGGGAGGTRTQFPLVAPVAGTGGPGGGGNGGYGGPGVGNGVPGVAGTANTGGGGGGGHYHACNPPGNNPAPTNRCMAGGAGGKGIVVIRYKFQ